MKTWKFLPIFSKSFSESKVFQNPTSYFTDVTIAHESVQESLGFSPFELVFGYTVRGPLKLLKEKLSPGSTESIYLLQYVSDFCTKLVRVRESAKAGLSSTRMSLKEMM